MGAIVTAEDLAAYADLAIGTYGLDDVIDAVEAAVTMTHNIPDPMTADFDHALLMWCARLWKRRTTVEGIASFGQDFAVRVNRFDPDIDQLLDPYRKFALA